MWRRYDWNILRVGAVWVSEDGSEFVYGAGCCGVCYYVSEVAELSLVCVIVSLRA